MNDAETAAAARSFRSTYARPGLAEPLARLYSQRVRVRNRQPGLEAWSPNEFASRLRDAVVLIEAGLVGRANGEPDSAPTIRRAAEILEWLSETERDSTSDGISLGVLA